MADNTDYSGSYPEMQGKAMDVKDHPDNNLRMAMNLPTPANDNRNLQIPDGAAQAVFDADWNKRAARSRLDIIPGGKK